MEPVTHLLTGACLSRAGLNRTTALATLTMTLAAEAPDIDVLASLNGSAFGFAHHRGFTHSFLGGILVAAGVVGLVWLLSRWKYLAPKASDPPVRWGLLFFYAYLGCLSHILLDFTNNYGVRPLWPFSERWYSWDIVFIAEPVLLLLLLAGLVLPKLFGLINEEVGAKRDKFPGRGGAIFALAGILLVWGVRDYQHRQALAALTARTYQGQDAIRYSASPYWINPFRWAAVVETPDGFVTMDVDSLTPEVDPEGRMRLHPKPEETAVTMAAKSSPLGRVYLDWGHYPLTEVEEVAVADGKGYVVRFHDLRFGYVDASRRNLLGATVELDSKLNVLREQMGETSSKRK